MFNILDHNLKAMHLHTEMLEACGWDEEECDRVLSIASDVIQDLDPPSPGLTLEQHLDVAMLPMLINRKVEDFQAEIIIKYMQHQKKFYDWALSTVRKG